MAELVNTDLVAAAERLASGSAEARAWVRDVSANAIAVDNEGPGLIGAAPPGGKHRAQGAWRRRSAQLHRRVRSEPSRKILFGLGAGAATRPVFDGRLSRRSAGLPPRDQSGRRPGIHGPGHAFLGDWRHQCRCAVSGRRSVCLSETDIVKILANSFFSDFDQNNVKLKPADAAVVRTAIAAAKPRQRPQRSLPISTRSISSISGEYFQKQLRAACDALGRERLLGGADRTGAAPAAG